MPEPIEDASDPMTVFNKMGMWDVSDVLSPLLDKFRKDKASRSRWPSDNPSVSVDYFWTDKPGLAPGLI